LFNVFIEFKYIEIYQDRSNFKKGLGDSYAEVNLSFRLIVQEKPTDDDIENRFLINGLDKVVEHLSIELRELQLENMSLKEEIVKLKERKEFVA